MQWTDLSTAPAVGTPLGAPPNSGALCLVVSTDRGDYPLILAQTGAGIRAWVNACPHQFLPLNYRSESILSADGTRLICSNHEAVFDAATGIGTGGFGIGCELIEVPVHIDPDGQARIGAGSD